MLVHAYVYMLNSNLLKTTSKVKITTCLKKRGGREKCHACKMITLKKIITTTKNFKKLAGMLKYIFFI